MRWRFDNRDRLNGRPERRSRWAAVLLWAVLLAPSLSIGAPGPDASAASRVPRPVIEPGAGDKCVEDTDFMRRNHMTLLKHQRDETVHNGIRTKQYSLNGCIECHASRKTGRVIGSDQNFCQGCHSYAAVRLDCFECHASKSKSAAAAMENRGQGIAPFATALPVAQPSGLAVGNPPPRTAR
jgi:hypothetical protein